MIERLTQALGPEARVRRERDAVLLTRPEWQEVSDPRELEALARAFVERANGLMKIKGHFVAPVRFDCVVYRGGDGVHKFFEQGTSTRASEQSILEETVLAHGVHEAPPVDPLGDWLSKGEGDDRLREALSLFGDMDGWPDLYKVYEFARNGLGGQQAVDGILGKPTASRLTRTINYYRHAFGYSLPTDPFSFDEAAALVGQLVESWLQHL
jgi:hypothetical protein